MEKDKGKTILIVFILIMVIVIVGIGVWCYNLIKNRDASNPANTINNTDQPASEEYNMAPTDTNSRLDSLPEGDTNNVSGGVEDQEVSHGPVDSEDEAVNLVKANWGEDSTVSIEFDSKDPNGNYIVVIRDKATTKSLYWYTVNASDGTMTVE